MATRKFKYFIVVKFNVHIVVQTTKSVITMKEDITMSELLKKLEELETLDIDQVELLATDIRTEYATIKESGSVDLDYVKELANALDVVTARQEVLVEEAKLALAEIAELDKKMGLVVEDEKAEDEADETADEAAGEETQEDVAVEASDEAIEEKVEEKELVGAQASRIIKLPALKQKTSVEIPEQAPKSLVFDSEGNARSKEEFATMFKKSMNSISRKTDIKSNIASFVLNDESVPKVGGFSNHVEANTVLSEILAKKNAELDKVSALKASGGPCVVPRQEFGFATIGGDCEPVGAVLPRVQSDAKGVSFYQDVDVFDDVPLTNGVNIYTAAQDISGAAYPKGCATLDCPTPIVCDKDIIEKCLRIGNWVDKAWPEYVDAMQVALDTHLANVAEEYRLNKIWTQANTYGNYFNETVQPLGLTDNLLDIILRYVTLDRAGIRDCSATRYNVILDEYVAPMLAVDIARRLNFGTDRLSIDAAVFELLRAENINISFKKGRDDFGTGAAGTALGTIIGTGPTLPAWKTTTRIAIFRDGTIVEEMGPELDLGVYRTQDDIEQNNYSMFMEYWTSVCFRNKHVFVVDAPICPNGAVSAAIPGPTC